MKFQERATMSSMRFGAWIPSYSYSGLDYPRARQGTDTFSRTANEHGIDLWVIDHLLHAPGLYGMAWLEPMTVVTHAAAVAPDVEMVGTGILVLPLRDPVLLAKQVATMDYLTSGRYQFGIGPGWYGPEFTATGTDISERGKRTDEILEAVKLLLTTPNASFEGRFYAFSDVTIEPRPPRVPNIWVSGGSRIPDGTFDNDVPVLATTVLNRILGADWWLSRCSGHQEWVHRDWQAIKDAAAARQTSCPRFAHCNFIHIVDTSDPVKARAEQHIYFAQAMGTHRSHEHLEKSYIFGSIDEIVERLRDLADGGCEYIVLGPTSDDPRQLDLLSRLVIPQVSN